MLKEKIGRIAAFLKKNFGKIAYYAAVAVVLVAVAIAAEGYREDAPGELILPAVELQEADTAPDIPEIARPGGMELVRAYANLPAWNAELCQWEAHPAADYRMEDGVVASLCAGLVRTIGESGVYGGFVEVECGDMLFRYASIQPDAALKAGEEIAAGDRIGTAANGMPGEQDMGNHLHLEVYENNKSVDFEAFASKNRQNVD